VGGTGDGSKGGAAPPPSCFFGRHRAFAANDASALRSAGGRFLMRAVPPFDAGFDSLAKDAVSCSMFIPYLFKNMGQCQQKRKSYLCSAQNGGKFGCAKSFLTTGKSR
jgi:hypothetical protein